ncbi:hypothetical protein DVH24_003682 [Malus domestica]|uniref:non-specific serine/threonine protein kinase n=1 Tax=Malus domestica TaxID=3750 RepID=A0A498ILY9_MALDO|nr:hypothetical protein DVH24_003682 [Malus domestica]
MEVLGFTPMAFLKWVLLACCIGSVFGLNSPTQSCYPNDFLALREFAGNLTNGSMITAWHNTSTCCQWDGVVCGNVNNGTVVASRVTQLILPSMSLSGTISRSLGRLDQLKLLNLSLNHLEGGLPAELSDLKHLEVLDLSNNMLSGPVSGALSGLNSIRVLNISSNSIHDDLSELGGGFSHLVVFNISNNSFTGQFNPRICSSSNETHILDMSWNRLVGSLEGLDNCSRSLQQLHLDFNSFSGYLPESLYTYSALEQLSVSGNSLSGQISKELSKLSSLKTLVISSNQFLGELPNVFGNLRRLEQLVAHSNMLSGPLASTLALCSNLRVLDLRNNSLSGSIDLNFTGLPKLCTLDLATNHFSGFLPNSLSNCRELKTLSLARNKLRGSIPEDFAKLTSLFFLSFILCVVISIGVGVALLLAVGLLKMSRRGAKDQIDDFDEDSRPHRISGALASSKLVLFQNSDCKDFTVSDLLKSTNNFNQANIIGCGGYGLVYKANLPNGAKAAIKRLSGDCGQMEREFQAEVEALSRAQHKNLVSLQGYCRHGNDRLLIYSYMENGSLDYWLHESVDGVSLLKWDVRLKIAQGAARGLAYLHKGCQPNIVHRDIKTSNILLDEKFEAHLADFGLSRLLRPYDTHVTTDLVGTLGYIPPEYSQTLTATCRGDVYSFGVVLLELLTGRRPVEVCRGKNCRDLVSWMFQMRFEKRDEEIIDSSIWNKNHEKQLLDVLGVACKCLDPNPRQRPFIEEVVSCLDGIGFESGKQ